MLRRREGACMYLRGSWFAMGTGWEEKEMLDVLEL